jgi:peptidase M28-like protein
MRKQFAHLFLLCFLVISPFAQQQAGEPAKTTTGAIVKSWGVGTHSTAKVCTACIRAHMEFLASDALRGRGSATPDELLAATYVASELRQYGVEPAGDNDGYIQRAQLLTRVVKGPPQLTFTVPDGATQREVSWTHGNEMLVLHMSQAEVSGPLQEIDLASGEMKVKPRSIVFLKTKDGKSPRASMFAAIQAGAAAVLVPEYPRIRERWEEISRQLPQLPSQLKGSPEGGLGEGYNLVVVNKAAASTLEQLPEGTAIRLAAPTSTSENSYTWNAIGILRGTDSGLGHAAVLFSAHLDHLGVGEPVKGDNIYNGADDDASGTTAVLELARVLGAGPRPRRTVIFALFGSEETGGLGSSYFREHPPIPLKDIAANLEFEMIGRPDAALKPNSMWLSGWERSNLGPVLAAHGAHLVRDPHLDQNFFARSDNYVLAKKGVVAQTVSSFGLHLDYHQPSDDLAHINFKHMTWAIESLLRPVQWLVNSDFKPKWNVGGKP